MMGLWGSQRQARARAVVDSLTATERVAGDLSLGDQSVLTLCRSLPPLSRCQMRFCPPNRALTAPALPLKAFVRAPFLLSRLFWLGGIQFLPARVGCGVPGPPKNIGAKMTTKPQDSSRTTRRPCYCSPPARGRLSLADGSQKRDHRCRRLSLRRWRSDKALLLFSRESCGSLRALSSSGSPTEPPPREVNKADDHGCVFRSSLLRWLSGLSARLGLADERWNAQY